MLKPLSTMPLMLASTPIELFVSLICAGLTHELRVIERSKMFSPTIPKFPVDPVYMTTRKKSLFAHFEVQVIFWVLLANFYHAILFCLVLIGLLKIQCHKYFSWPSYIWYENVAISIKRLHELKNGLCLSYVLLPSLPLCEGIAIFILFVTTWWHWNLNYLSLCSRMIILCIFGFSVIYSYFFGYF